MMSYQHATLASGLWQMLTLTEQLGNIGSEVTRALKRQADNPERFHSAVNRALELLDLTIQDPRWQHRLKEITRARELLCDAAAGGQEYHTPLADLDRYFYHFAYAARVGKGNDTHPQR
ncbi:MAG: hypothetical protein V1778_03395 [bacterium]